jgi:hypothetical protein
VAFALGFNYPLKTEVAEQIVLGIEGLIKSVFTDGILGLLDYYKNE